MKFNFDLILPYRPRNKCGAESAMILGAQGIMSAGASIFNADQQSGTNRQQMNFTREENQKNRDFQSAEADKARVWQAQEWSRQFQAQASQWYKQLAAQQRAQQQNFQFEAEYNSPSNQIARLAEAGINPSAVMGGQGSSGLVSAASGNIGAAPSPSAPSGGNVAAPMPSGSASGVSLQAPQIDLGGIGTFFAQMSKAYQENEKLRPEIDNVIASTQNLLADKYTKELLQTAQIMQNDILSQTKDAQIHQIWENLTSTYLDQKLKLLQGENIEADTAFKLADEFLTRCKSKLSWEQYLQAAFTTSHMLETWTNEQNVLRSQIGLNVAGAADHYASVYEHYMGGDLKFENAETERQVREFKVKNEHAISEINYYTKEIYATDAAINKETANYRLVALTKQLYNEALQADILTDIQRQTLKRAINENDWYTFNTVMGAITGTVNAGASAVNAGANLSRAGSYAKFVVK